MSKKLLALVIAGVLALSCGPASATLYWASGVVGDWDVADTWGGAGIPGSGDNAYLNVGSTVTVNGTAEAANELHLASWSGNSDLVTLDITAGGSLTVGGWAYLGVANGDVGELNVEAGSTLTCNSAMNVGYNGHCTMNVNGGTVYANGGMFTSNPWAAGTGSGTINLVSGTIHVSTDFAMSSTGLIDIEGGTLRIYGLWWDALLNSYIGNSQIIGYGGTQPVDISYDGDYTVLSAIPEPATIALLLLGGVCLRRKSS